MCGFTGVLGRSRWQPSVLLTRRTKGQVSTKVICSGVHPAPKVELRGESNVGRGELINVFSVWERGERWQSALAQLLVLVAVLFANYCRTPEHCQFRFLFEQVRAVACSSAPPVPAVWIIISFPLTLPPRCGGLFTANCRSPVWVRFAFYYLSSVFLLLLSVVFIIAVVCAQSVAAALSSRAHRMTAVARSLTNCLFSSLSLCPSTRLLFLSPESN